MKISYNWLKTYIDIFLPPEELADLLTDIGLEVEGISHYESIPGGLKGIVAGRVLEVQPHPDADKLTVCRVDAGNGQPLQIVCGAPNVAEGQMVPVATVGTDLYTADGERFRIKKAKLRGVASEGMICAEDELGLGDDHSGILVLPEDTAPGLPLQELYPVTTDTVFEIGLTPNRSDAFHHIGVARDLRAALNYRENSGLELQWPDISGFTPGKGHPVAVKVEDPAACPRYCGLVIEGLQVGPSPAWLQDRLLAIGQRPINNVVDITNYILHEYGQPLHAFDLRQVNGHIVVQQLPEGSRFTTLDEVERKLSAEDLMICNAREGMCIAGVFGGMESGVKDDTTGIFLESAFFSPTSIRKTSTRHGLRTDAAGHFEKGVDPAITVTAMQRAAVMICEIAGGTVVSDITDLAADAFSPCPVRLYLGQLNKLAGVDIPVDDVKRILGLLDILTESEQEGFLELLVPRYRPDVHREADVIEEVMRIYGFNNIPVPVKLNASIGVEDHLSPDELYDKAADFLVGNGFFEIMVNSITREKYNPHPERQVRLLNNLNAELTVMRQSLLHTGLEAVLYNQNRSNRDCKFFELGSQYGIGEEGYSEVPRLSVWMTGNIHAPNWLSKAQPVNFHYLKSMVERILETLGFSGCRSEGSDNEYLDHAIRLLSGRTPVATYGVVKADVLDKMDIGAPVMYGEIHWDAVLELQHGNDVKFREIPKYPSVRRDLSLLLDRSVNFDQIAGIARKAGRQLLRDVDLFDVYQDKKMEEDKKSYAISFIFRDDHKTLIDKEVDEIMKQMIEGLQRELSAVIR